jgi:delta 1-pyrroline-5-carboxylate dehydrogenase
MSPGKTANISFDSDFGNVINGESRTKSENYHQGVNPATGEKLWDVPIANQSDVDEAVASAEKAFKSWSVKPIEERKELLRNFRDLWSGYQEEFTTLLCKETGKPRQFAAMEVGAVGAWFDHHVSLSIPEERLEDDEKVMTTRYMPLGVVGAICPWNVCFPFSVMSLDILLTMFPVPSGSLIRQDCSCSSYWMHNHRQALAFHSLHLVEGNRAGSDHLPSRCRSGPRW